MMDKRERGALQSNRAEEEAGKKVKEDERGRQRLRVGYTLGHQGKSLTEKVTDRHCKKGTDGHCKKKGWVNLFKREGKRKGEGDGQKTT